MSQVPYVDFYRKHKVSPVAQDLSNFSEHLERREYLYRTLGVPTSFIRNGSVIEFGPGSGHNGLYTLSCSPKKYDLVDGNMTGIEGCKELFNQYFKEQTSNSVSFTHSLFSDFATEERYDLVLGEGFLPAMTEPEEAFLHLASFLDKKGIYIITTHDSISLLADNLRCYLGSLLADPKLELEKQLEILRPIFKEQLDSLSSMTRSHDDWIIDNVIHKSLWLEANFFSIEKAIACAEASALDLDFFHSSPSFVQDWRWYKSINTKTKAFNERARQSYFENVHNFLNCNETYSPRKVEENRVLIELSDKLTYSIRDHYRDRSAANLSSVKENLELLSKHISDFCNSTSQALRDFSKGLDLIIGGKPVSSWGSFSQFWGRGMQYASFIRNS